MSKKVVIGLCAVIAFFLGAIWVDSVPTIAPLVVFLELCAGFACGFFLYKDMASVKLSSKDSLIADLGDKLTKREASLKTYENMVEDLQTQLALKKAAKKTKVTKKE